MLYSLFILISVDIGSQVIGRFAADGAPAFHDMTRAAFRRPYGKHFHPIAGGQDQGLRDIFARRKRPCFGRAEVGQGKLFPDFYRCSAVIQPYEMNGMIHDIQLCGQSEGELERMACRQQKIDHKQGEK